MTGRVKQLWGHVGPPAQLSLALGLKREPSSAAEFNQHLLTGVRLSEELFHSLSESLGVTQQQLLWRLRRPWSPGLIQNNVTFFYGANDPSLINLEVLLQMCEMMQFLFPAPSQKTAG